MQLSRSSWVSRAAARGDELAFSSGSPPAPFSHQAVHLQLHQALALVTGAILGAFATDDIDVAEFTGQLVGQVSRVERLKCELVMPVLAIGLPDLCNQFMNFLLLQGGGFGHCEGVLLLRR